MSDFNKIQKLYELRDILQKSFATQKILGFQKLKEYAILQKFK